MVEETKDKTGRAMAGFVLGIISIPTVLLPILDLPVGLLIFSLMGKKSSISKKAKIGIILSSIGLVLTILASLGAYLLQKFKKVLKKLGLDKIYISWYYNFNK